MTQPRERGTIRVSAVDRLQHRLGRFPIQRRREIIENIRAAEACGAVVTSIAKDGELRTDMPALNRQDATYIVFDGEFIKIGTSRNWEGRLESIRSDNPRTIIALAVYKGGREFEQALHTRFASHRILPNREWFRDHPDIRAFISENASKCIRGAA